MERLAPPPKFSASGNAAEQWRAFKQAINFYLKATETASKPDEQKVAILLTVGGPALLDAYNTIDFGTPTTARPHPELDYENVLTKLGSHFAPKQNEVYSRYVFRCRTQQQETFDSFLTDLKLKARDCNFGAERDKMIRDQVVVGTNDEKARADILKIDNPTLEKVVRICLAQETTKSQLKAFKNGATPTDSVHGVKETRHRVNAKKPPKQTPQQHNCGYCGGNHEKTKQACPAWKKTCNKCKRKNHFAAQCRAKNVANVEASESSDEEILAISRSDTKKSIFTTLRINGNELKFQVDSGAAVNVITSKDVRPEQIVPTRTTLRMWNDSTVTPVGKCKLDATTKNGKKHKVEFIVVDEELTPLVGRETAEKMGLIVIDYRLVAKVEKGTASVATRNDIVKRYPDVFGSALGTLPGKVHLVTDPEAQPKAVTGCRVPVSVKPQLATMLQQMEERGVITKVEEPTTWVSRMVIATKKAGDLRICIDPQALNKALGRERHPLPVLDDILPELAKAKVFTKLDLRDGYWQCVLDKESSMLTTFQTPAGRYRWL